MANDFVAHFKEWANRPFRAEMSLSDYFMLVGATLIFVLLWNVLLHHFFDALKGE